MSSEQTWYVHFRTRTGHTNTHKVKATNAQGALVKATTEYRDLQRISLLEAQDSVTELGLWTS